MKKYYGLGLAVSFPLAILLHYLIFSKINLHPTINAAIGMGLLFVILGTVMLILKKK